MDYGGTFGVYVLRYGDYRFFTLEHYSYAEFNYLVYDCHSQIHKFLTIYESIYLSTE